MRALITGGSGGLGFFIAKELRKRGYEPILIARDETKLRRAAEELQGKYFVIDLSKNFHDAGKIIEEYKPRVLVNNAGFGLYGKLSKQNWDRIESMLMVNVVALTYLTKKFIEVNEKGYILNISSVAACRAQRKLSVYAGSKSYVAQFTRSLKKELTEDIHVSYLLLGPTRTNFFKNAGMPTKGFKKLMLSPERVAKYAVDKMFKGKIRIVPGLIYKLYCL